MRTVAGAPSCARACLWSRVHSIGVHGTPQLSLSLRTRERRESANKQHQRQCTRSSRRATADVVCYWNNPPQKSWLNIKRRSRLNSWGYGVGFLFEVIINSLACRGTRCFGHPCGYAELPWEMIGWLNMVSPRRREGRTTEGQRAVAVSGGPVCIM
jgi:hypothetical protein